MQDESVAAVLAAAAVERVVVAAVVAVEVEPVRAPRHAQERVRLAFESHMTGRRPGSNRRRVMMPSPLTTATATAAAAASQDSLRHQKAASLQSVMAHRGSHKGLHRGWRNNMEGGCCCHYYYYYYYYCYQGWSP